MTDNYVVADFDARGLARLPRHFLLDPNTLHAENKDFHRIQWQQEEVVVEPNKPDAPTPSVTEAAGSCSTGGDITAIKQIGNTDITYGIITFGAKFHIGFDMITTLEINGKSYPCKTHKTVKGRIDGLKAMYAQNNIGLGDMLQATYHSSLNVITVVKI